MHIKKSKVQVNLNITECNQSCILLFKKHKTYKFSFSVNRGLNTIKEWKKNETKKNRHFV